MCGITGIWHFDGRCIDRHVFDRFTDSLAHRGPDGRGTHIDERQGLALGHRLLAIQGIASDNAQPMCYGGRYWLTFNGEVYNFVELRETLAGLGHRFHTTTDSEVVVAAYAQWGEDCLLRFNGMWALAVWDARERKLFLAVDRFGVKSCVYRHGPDYFAFASELKAFSFLDRYDVDVNRAETARILATGGVRVASATWMKDVYRLAAGHSLTIEAGKAPVKKRWWNTLDHLVEVPRSFDAQVELFRSLFASSVDLRLRSDARIAVPLSGGMDSSAVLAMAVRAPTRRDDLGCFFVQKQGELDETPYAMSMARHAQVTPTVVPHMAAMDVDTMQSVIYAYENFIVASAGPYSLYKAVRESGACVTLDGHGGDELLGGYPSYMSAAFNDAMTGLPNPWRVAELARINRRLTINSESLSFTEGWGNTWRLVKEAARARMGREVKYGSTGSVLMTQPDDRFPAGFDELARALYQDVHYGFMQRVLRSFDSASMAHGVEARTPFLDWRIVTALFSMPSHAKIGRGYTKCLLRHAMRGLIPNDVLWRRSKIGFVGTDSYFCNPAIFGWMQDVMASRDFIESGLWDGPRFARAIARWKASPQSFALGRKLIGVAQAHYLIQRVRQQSLASRQSCANAAIGAPPRPAAVGAAQETEFI
ncbi:asparagine synthase (glutamine-hydrolyzing) [Burkholderia sp. Bp9126]|nr:asparagine synthase (glutamine-hydrolyzing) [Burkholderia sp. Bp9126]